MSSAPALPGPGAAVSLRVSAAEAHPEAPVVRLWALLNERREDYARLRRDVQAAAGPRLAASSEEELRVGELCLVELGGRWHRCRVLSCRERDYRVFLLDEGRAAPAAAHYLARGPEELFRLPPEALGCVVADVVLVGGGDLSSAACAARAAEFLACLHGKEVSGLVREVMVPQLLVVLELPQLAAQMHHLGLAKLVASSWFCLLLKRCLAHICLQGQLKPQPVVQPLATPVLPQLPHVFPLGQPLSAATDYFYPQLQLGVTEPVLVTQVSDPHHMYCQLRSLSQEIHRLSDTMHQVYDGAACEQGVPPRLGSPCAARGISGHWYRALLLEVVARERDQQVAQVIFVDYGRKEFVTAANLRHLPAECFRMPVVTYPCALRGISHGGHGWSPSQISELKALLLGKRVNAHIETFNSFEHLYYVSLYGEDGMNLNSLFGVQARCLASSLRQIRQTETRDQVGVEDDVASPPGAPRPDLMRRHLASVPIVGTHLKSGVFYDAQLSHLQDPSEFWLQLQEHRQLLSQLMQNMWNFYLQATNLVMQDLQPGSFCATRKDGAFHRAVITRVMGNAVEIHLVDRGNTETVDCGEVKELPPKFRELPALALKCCLAGASPHRGNWSEEAVSAFRKIVLNKVLKIHVLGAQGDKYVVEILDQSQLGEKSVSKIMTQEGYAKYQRSEIPEMPQKSSDRAARPGSSPGSGGEEKQINTAERLRGESDPKRNDRALNPYMTRVKGGSVALHSSKTSESVPAERRCESMQSPPACVAQNYLELKPGSYGGQLEVGSTVNVVVSYVESPGYFWCQLSRNCQDLKTLMTEIQEYCKNSSQPHIWPNPVCLAQYSEDEKWYRALIVSEFTSAKQVEVIYVDYGNRELVSRANLRSINEKFLDIKAQAFRCSLYNLIQPNGLDPFVWDEKAILAFQEFIDASSCHLELKCTIFALASINNKELFNIVDLMTPFQSACHFLIEKGLARPLSPQKPLASSVQLHSYYYSMHDIKIGSEEDVYITHVDDPWNFYCQLARCTDVLAKLAENIGHLSKIVTASKTLQNPGNLCLARYSDNHWYRGVVNKTKPNREVFFVDFGNTELVRKEDMLPIPSGAYDVLLLPMQAIKCSLSDISTVPEEAMLWFKQAVLERRLKAVVVAKESDGKLLIELFDGNIQINAKLKKGVKLANSAELLEKRDCSFPIGKDKLLYVKSDTESQCVPFKNISDLPQKNIVPTFKVLVYVSHVNNPLDFYVQLVSDESRLNSISESLNSKMRVENSCGQLLRAGDLISAVYSEDNLWYRAVVKDKSSDNLISVQYIDYGNTSVINVNQVCRLPEDSSSVPAMGIHCFLGGLKYEKPADWSEKAKLVFSERTSEVQVTCEFVEKVGDKWEVILSDSAGIITVELVDENLPSGEKPHSTKVLDKRENCTEMVNVSKPLSPNEQNEISSVSGSESFVWRIPEAGQTVKIYVTVVKGPEYFWSQCANRENIKYIEEKIKEAENLGLNSMDDFRSCVKAGDICIAKCSEDGKLCRAKVSNIKGDHLVVRYVDYGTEETVNMEMVRRIPSELLKIPNQAFPCCLSGFNSSEGSWLSEAEVKLRDMTVELLLEAKVIETREVKASEVPLSVVEMEACGKSINEEMKCFWKACTESGDTAFLNLENSLKENTRSGSNMDRCLEKETTAACRILQEEGKSECVLDVTSVCSSNVEASVEVEVEECMSGKAADECKTTEHPNSFDKETSGFEQESGKDVSLEPAGCRSLCVLRSDVKAAEQKLSEVPLVEDVELKAELSGAALAVSPLENKQELVGWPLLQMQPSVGDETGSLLELEQLQMDSSYDDLKEFMLELGSFSVPSSLGEKTKEALEIDSPATETPPGREAKEERLELESLEVPRSSDETGELAAVKCSEITPPSHGRENLVPPVSNGEKTLELFPSDVQALELDLPVVHEVEALQNDWMEVDPTLLSSFGGGAEKQLELETHDIQSVLGAEIKQLLELVLPDVQPPQEDRDEDLLGLEVPELQTCAKSRNQFLFLKTDPMNRRPVCTAKSCDCKIEKCEEWQKKRDGSSVEGWMKRDLSDTLKKCGSELLNEQTFECKPVGEEIIKKQNENLGVYHAEHSEYTCNLKGFAVGSKCMVWTSLKWCEARILEVSEKGTRVLNLSNGSEEIVDPENVWNGIPDWACRSSEAVTNATANLESLVDESKLQEKQTGCSSDLAEDPCVL
ncbi:tudor domain-containing protein 6 [Eudromia elegans]